MFIFVFSKKKKMFYYDIHTHQPSVLPEDIAIVNTCSFLTSATSESIETTLELANEVQDGVRSCPIVMSGCVPSRYGDDLPDELPEDAPEPVRNLREVLSGISLRNLQECYNDAIYYRDEMRQLFSTGRVNLRQRTLAERFFWAIIMRIAQEKTRLKNVPRDLADIDVSLADIYYGNFSVFQSLPDSWAIDQLFPIMPVHRLKEFPSRQGIISDITCDSDGRIDHFIDPQGMKSTLDLHPLRDGEEYYLGVFLVGAYQETLGDLHNLMGDTNVVSIRASEDGSYEYVREIRGDSVADILSYVEYDPRRILEDLRSTAEQAVRQGRISPSERFAVMQAFEDGLRGYTYFER